MGERRFDVTVYLRVSKHTNRPKRQRARLRPSEAVDFLGQRTREAHFMNNIDVSVRTRYIEDQSNPAANQFVYTYTILIKNKGSQAAQLISRHWYITDAREKVQEVQGLGVVGEQPTIAPGESYSYSSGVVLATESGIMNGTYTLKNEDGSQFTAKIPAFSLVQPSALH